MSRLDDIIDSHAIIDERARQELPAPEDGFRHFTREDWLAWSGCETEHPQVHESEKIVVVIDGRNVYATPVTDDEFLLFAREFQSESVSRAIARAIALTPEPDVAFVEAMLGDAGRGHCWIVG